MKTPTAPITQNGCSKLICTTPSRYGNLQFKGLSFHLVVHQTRSTARFHQRGYAFRVERSLATYLHSIERGLHSISVGSWTHPAFVFPVHDCYGQCSHPGTERIFGLRPRLTFAPLTLPDPVNAYRSGDGAPGPSYWQNEASYELHAELETAAKQLRATEIITYTNNSPDTLPSLWIQLEQNIYRKDSRGQALFASFMRRRRDNPSANAKPVNTSTDGFVFDSVEIESGKQTAKADYIVNHTRMQIRLCAAAQTSQRPAKNPYQVTAHEIGHDWFPMIVGSNDRRHALMDEAFNTFIDIDESTTYANGKYGPKRDSEYSAGGEPPDTIPKVLDNLDAPSLTAPADSYGFEPGHPLSYFKGAHGMVLLREQILGPDRFEWAFRKYIRDWGVQTSFAVRLLPGDGERERRRPEQVLARVVSQ